MSSLKPRKSIRSFFIAYLLLTVILPALLLGGTAFIISSLSLHDELTKANARQMRLMVKIIEQYLSDPKEEINTIRYLLENGPPPLQKHLKSVISGSSEAHDYILSLQLADNSGTVTSGYPDYENVIGTDVSGQTYFQETKRTGTDYWAPSFVSDLIDTPVSTLSIPWRDGVITAFLDLKRISDLAAESGFEEYGRIVMVTDQNGVFIAHPDEQKVLTREYDPLFKHCLHQWKNEPLTSILEYEDQNYLAHVIFIEQAGWKVGVYQPLSTFYRPIKTMALWLAVLVGCVLLIAVFLGNRLSRGISSSLNNLVSSSRIISAGNYDQVLPETKFHEFSQLADSFQQMAENVRLREAKLRESDERFRTLVANIPGVNYRCKYDKHWTMEFISNEVFRLSGYPADDFINNLERSYNSIIHPEDKEHVTTRVFEAVENRLPFSVEYRIIHANGSLLYVYEKGQAVYDSDGTLLCLDGVIVDITERIEAEGEVTRVRNYLTSILNSMPSVLVGVDREGLVTQWNALAAEKTGVAPESSIGQPFEAVYPQLAEIQDQVHEALRTGRVVIQPGRQKTDAHGELCYEDITIYPLITPGVEGAVIRIDDVTEQTKIEEMMIQSEKMLSVGGLAAGMAHEINNPLAGILGYIQILQRRLFSDVKSSTAAASEMGVDMELTRQYLKKIEADKMLEDVAESGKRAAKIVKNMLSFSRKTDKQFLLHSPSSLIENTIDLASNDYNLRKHYDFKNVKIIKEFRTEKSLECDANEIQQVLLNLVKNATEAFSESHSKTKEPAITFRLLSEHEDLIIEVEDNGAGMDENTRRRIFEPFFTTKPVDKGTGLGLSVSYYIITKLHKGRMEVESSPGQGTKFIIRLPLKGENNNDARNSSAR